MKIYAYVDNSNVFIEGQRLSAVTKGMAHSLVDAMNRKIVDHDWQLDYGKLFQLACGDKQHVKVANLWGSPPPGDSFWEMVRSKGFKVVTYDRNIANKEKKVDVAIAHAMTKDAYSGVIDKADGEIVLLSGDKDYVPVVEDLVEQGFHVTVMFWGHAASELAEAATEFVSMDNWLGLLEH